MAMSMSAERPQIVINQTVHTVFALFSMAGRLPAPCGVSAVEMSSSVETV